MYFNNNLMRTKHAKPTLQPLTRFLLIAESDATQNVTFRA